MILQLYFSSKQHSNLDVLVLLLSFVFATLKIKGSWKGAENYDNQTNLISCIMLLFALLLSVDNQERTLIRESMAPLYKPLRTPYTSPCTMSLVLFLLHYNMIDHVWWNLCLSLSRRFNDCCMSASSESRLSRCVLLYYCIVYYSRSTNDSDSPSRGHRWFRYVSTNEKAGFVTSDQSQARNQSAQIPLLPNAQMGSETVGTLTSVFVVSENFSL